MAFGWYRLFLAYFYGTTWQFFCFFFVFSMHTRVYVSTRGCVCVCVAYSTVPPNAQFLGFNFSAPELFSQSNEMHGFISSARCAHNNIYALQWMQRTVQFQGLLGLELWHNHYLYQTHASSHGWPCASRCSDARIVCQGASSSSILFI